MSEGVRGASDYGKRMGSIRPSTSPVSRGRAKLPIFFLPSYLLTFLPSVFLSPMNRDMNPSLPSLPDRVAKYILSRPDSEFGELTVEKLARVFGVDRFKLSKSFKAEKDMNISDFLKKEKMTRCVFLLRSHQKMTVKEIADLMGFCTCDYFIREFKKHFGMGPGQYKECKTEC